MRIALVHMRHARSGGTERYLDQLAAALAAREHEVRIVCRSHIEPPHPSIRFEVLHPRAFGGAWRMWAFAQAVERHVRTTRYDLVVGLGKTWSQDVLRLGGGVQRTYLELAHRATLGPWERLAGGGWLKQRLACAIEDRALAPGAARTWICNSEMVRRDVLARFALDPARVAVVHNGVDLERFHPRLRAASGAELRRALGFSEGDIVVLFLGTGYGRKGLAPLLEAFPALRRERPAARLLIVGYDSALARHRAHAEELGLGGVARFLGGRDTPEACFAASDLYVLPTLYDPFANSTLEALACGLPTLTTDTNGAAELFAGSGAGQVVPGRDGAAELRAALLGWTVRERIEAARPAARALAERNGHERAMRLTLEWLERAQA